MGGFFGFFDYSKPGKGVPENAPPEKSAIVFYKVFFRKFWKLVQVNLLYVLAVIPCFVVLFFLGSIVLSPLLITETIAESPDIALILTVMFSVNFICLWGAGPATAVLVYVLLNSSRDKHT